MNDSTLLIQSTNKDNTRMGTGFVIYQDSFGSYVLTCSHVLQQVVTPKIANFDMDVIVKAEDDVLDLALLYVKGLFKTPFELQGRKCISDDVVLIGFSGFLGGEYQGKPREVNILGDKVTMVGKKENFTYYKWQVIAKDNNDIEAGNSGGPLICQESGKVIGVMSNNKKREQGYAVSIEHLKELWAEMPRLLLEGNASPFIGLSAFSIKEAHLFFGRDREISEITEKLKKEELVAVVGDSGSGKSSVIKAGVIPKYLSGILDIKSDLEKDSVKRNYHLIETRPAENPFTELSANITQISDAFQVDSSKINNIQKAINEKDISGIFSLFQSIYIDQEDQETYLLLYIDQFEELFTLCSDELEKEFMEFLLYLLNHQSSKLKIKIIFTMRRDYYNRISEYEEFFTRTQASKYTLRRMENEQINECIEKPLEKTFIPPEQISAFSKAVLQDMGDESSELTLLQIALTQTWQQRKKYDNNLLRTYHEIGEVSGALAKLADNTWHILSPIEQKISQYIMIRIIKPSETGGVIRRLADKNEFSDDAWHLAQKLSSALDSQGDMASEKNAQLGRLLKIKGKEGKVLELSHEALIRQWPMYQTWLRNVSKDDLKRTHDYVMEQNKIYQTQGKKIKFLLRGYELERSEKLLGDGYREYLSEDEVGFIEKSLLKKRVGWGAVIGVALVVIGLAGFLYILNSNLNDANEEVGRTSSKLLKLTDGVIKHIIDTPKEERGFELEYKIFSDVVYDFKLEKDNTQIAKIVAKA